MMESVTVLANNYLIFAHQLIVQLIPHLSIIKHKVSASLYCLSYIKLTCLGGRAVKALVLPVLIVSLTKAWLHFQKYLMGTVARISSEINFC